MSQQSIQRIIIVWCDRTVCRGLSHSNIGTFRLINRPDSGCVGREGDGKLFWTFQVFIDTFVLQGKWTYYTYKYSICTGICGTRPGHGFISSPEDLIWSVPSPLVLNRNLFPMWIRLYRDIRLRNWIPASAFTGDWTKLSLTSMICLTHRCVHINMGLGYWSYRPNII
jgi:hypothetical protein